MEQMMIICFRCVGKRCAKHGHSSPLDTPLERRMNAIRDGFLGIDEERYGGAEVLHALIEFCNHRHPEELGSTRAYLDYRWEDIANRYDINCCSAQSSERLS